MRKLISSKFDSKLWRRTEKATITKKQVENCQFKIVESDR